MFQNYSSPAAIDPTVTYRFGAPTSGPFHVYTVEDPGLGFSLTAEDFPLSFEGLAAAPRDSLLIVNAGLNTASLSTMRAVFYNGSDCVGEFPIAGTNLGLFQGAVPIPRDALRVAISLEGGAGPICGQIRVVTREHIPYQPLKG